MKRQEKLQNCIPFNITSSQNTASLTVTPDTNKDNWAFQTFSCLENNGEGVIAIQFDNVADGKIAFSLSQDARDDGWTWDNPGYTSSPGNVFSRDASSTDTLLVLDVNSSTLPSSDVRLVLEANLAGASNNPYPSRDPKVRRTQ